jgi:hypothetical protein
LKQLWEWYEQRRLAGLHEGPRYQGLRVYSIFWKGDLDASNLREPRRLQQLGEYVRGG